MTLCRRNLTRLVAAMCLLLLSGQSADARDFGVPYTYPPHTEFLDVPYVPTKHPVVAAMLDVTNVGPGDYVIDLGSGDGRIVIAAAQRGAFGHGMDLDPALVKISELNAGKAGVSDRVVFLHQNLFEADISRATVITMFLLASVNKQLKPALLDLRPGTRVVSNTYDMGDWEPDEHLRVDNRNIFYWMVPANLRGSWAYVADGQTFTMDIRQTYQKISVDLRAQAKRFEVQDPVVIGERVSFNAVDPDSGKRFVFSGRVDGNAITGTMQARDDANRKIENWNATLRSR
jgi:precorrin-6B methylase 2